MAAEIKITVTSTASGGGVASAVKDLRDLDTTARGAQGGLTALGATAATALGGVLASAATSAAGAVVGFVGTSISAAGDFEGAVNNLAAISGTALEDAGFSFDDVSAKALQLGQDTAFSASESIAAMTELVKGGVPVVDVMGDATDATLALAAASGTELASAAEIVSKQLGVWGDTGVGATEVSDLLTQAANASTVGVEDLALGLANAGGTAKVAGVEFGDLVQSMALIAPNFSSAADAGTSFKTFISRLVPTTGPATKAMQELGLYTEETGSVFYDQQGNFVGMETAATLLKDATAGLSEEQKLLAFNTIFGSDAIRAAAAIAESGGEGFAAMGASMAGAGTAAETAAIQNQGFNFALDSMKGSMETLQIVVGTLLLPVLTDLMTNVVSPAINTVTQFAQGFADAGDKGAFLQQKMTEVGAALQAWFAENMPKWIEGLGQMGAKLVAWVVESLPGLITNLMDARTALVNWVLESLPGWAEQLAQLGAKLMQWVIDALPELGTNLGKVAALLIEKTGEFIATTAPKLLELGGKFILWVAEEVLPKLPGKLAEIAAALVTGIGNFLTEISPEIVKVANMFIDWVQNEVLPKAPGKIAEIGTAIVQGITDFIAGVEAESAKVGQSVIDGMVSAISNGIGAVIQAAKDMAQAALDAAMDIIKPGSPSKVFTALGLTIPQGMVAGIDAGIPAVAATSGGMAGAAVGATVSTVNRSFTYAPTISTGSVGVADLATARALARGGI